MTAYYLRISDWSSDVCSSDLIAHHQYGRSCVAGEEPAAGVRDLIDMAGVEPGALPHAFTLQLQELGIGVADAGYIGQLGEILGRRIAAALIVRSEEHTSELQSLMRTSYAVFCLKHKNNQDSDERPCPLH